MKKKTIGIFLLVLLVVGSVILGYLLWQNKRKAEERENTITTIENMKQETGATANTELYEIGKEYDGREVLVVKPELEYQVAWAGLIKKELPTYEELDSLLEQQPKKTGVWIETDSRERVMQLLKDSTKVEYEINQEGYLSIKGSKEQANEQDKIIIKAIEGKKTFLLAVTGSCYQIDNMTGEILLYPFERMDAYQTYETFSSQDTMLIFLTQNKENKLKSQEIVNDLVSLLQ